MISSCRGICRSQAFPVLDHPAALLPKQQCLSSASKLRSGTGLVSSRSLHLLRTRAAASEDNLSSEEDDGDENPETEELEWDMKVDPQTFRDNLEKFVDNNDSSFNGRDLASLIRKKYGRSYDVQIIKKVCMELEPEQNHVMKFQEFMGRKLLAMNVMWKYREQRSFPLSEEEYILHLDDVANTLKFWGAVSIVRSGIEKTKERPRTGKAVSIFIDVNQSDARSNEWINR